MFRLWLRRNRKVIVALGDSITDGAASANDANGSWPDVLSKRLPALPDGTPVGVINMGIGSNRLLTSDAAGPAGLSVSKMTCFQGRMSRT